MWKRRAAAVLLAAALLAPLAPGANIPRQSPEFAINTAPGGRPVLLSTSRGKVVVMLFILTYCAHCQKTIEALIPLQKEYQARGFQVFASAIEDMAMRAVPDFLKRYNPPFPVGYNDRNQVLDYLQLPVMNRLLMPQMAIIDRKGVIRAQFPGDNEIFNDDIKGKLVKQIEPLLKEGAGAPAKKAVPAKGAAKSKQ
jgi:thiol-disulfide isomerase/thioredoxin